MLLSHQADAGSTASRVCAGWAGCHDTGELLALRLAVITGRMDRRPRGSDRLPLPRPPLPDGQ
ncbi:DUF6283 family protein [Streptomyces sp. NPDC015684]|uniref:DUF6283 family protein n=1 Tax=Streptomyces sp. NPDC015684 TaxID=3364963 RepID=UPI0036FDB11E